MDNIIAIKFVFFICSIFLITLFVQSALEKIRNYKRQENRLRNTIISIISMAIILVFIEIVLWMILLQNAMAIN